MPKPKITRSRIERWKTQPATRDLGRDGPQASQCSMCVHFYKGTVMREKGRAKCAAYPSGIPDYVIDNTMDHRRHVIGADYNIQWAPRDEDAEHPLGPLEDMPR